MSAQIQIAEDDFMALKFLARFNMVPLSL